MKLFPYYYDVYNPMTISTKTYLTGVMTAGAMFTTGCIYEYPHCQDAGDVGFEIANDWLLAPDAQPEGMAYLFYRDDTDRPWRFDFPGREAGEVTLPTGRYGFLMYNDDTAHVIFDTSPDGDMIATTAEVADNFAMESPIPHEAPDMMWGFHASNVCIDSDALRYDYATTGGDIISVTSSQKKLITWPRPLTPAYTVRVLNTANWTSVASCRGIITDMASGLDLATLLPLSSPADIGYAMKMSSDSVLTATFHNFGLIPGSTLPNNVVLCFTLHDGSTVYKTYDMTDQLRNAPDPMHITLTIDSISLPYVPDTGSAGAFDVDVTPWKDIVVDYQT